MVFQTHPLPGSEHGVYPPKNYSFSFEDEDQTWDFYFIFFPSQIPPIFSTQLPWRITPAPDRGADGT